MFSFTYQPRQKTALKMSLTSHTVNSNPPVSTQGSHYKTLLRPLAKALCIVGLTFAPSIYATEYSSQILSPPAEVSPLAQHSLMLDAANAGSRLIAVGHYGHILYSDNEGGSWTQAQVPISTTLTAVYFVDSQFGWAVGHEGVVLSTSDGGVSWQQQLNGLEINKLGLERAQQLLTYPDTHNGELPTDIHPDITVDDIELLEMDAADFAAEGASRPLLDVWFRNRDEGIIVGAYGLILHTSDGGKSWAPGFDRLHNIDNFHYYSIIPAMSAKNPKALFLVGESGLLQRSLNSGQTWETLESPYEGTFFGGLYNPVNDDLLIYGLRGNIYRSTDLGSSWQVIDNQTTATIFDGDLLENGSVLLTGSAGLQMTIDPSASQAKPRFSPKRTPYSAVNVTHSGKVLLAGLRGVELVSDFGSEQ